MGVRPGTEDKGWGVGRWDQMQLTNQDNGALPLVDALRKQGPASPPILAELVMENWLWRC